jgi:hypothetical protein
MPIQQVNNNTHFHAQHHPHFLLVTSYLLIIINLIDSINNKYLNLFIHWADRPNHLLLLLVVLLLIRKYWAGVSADVSYGTLTVPLVGSLSPDHFHKYNTNLGNSCIFTATLYLAVVLYHWDSLGHLEQTAWLLLWPHLTRLSRPPMDWTFKYHLLQILTWMSRRTVFELAQYHGKYVFTCPRQ